MTIGNVFQHLRRSWVHHFGLQIATVLVLSLVLTILSMIFSVRENLGRMDGVWGDDLELTLYLRDQAPAAAVQKFMQELGANEQFSQVHLVDRDEALQKFVSRMGSLAPDFVKSPEFDNPLPTSIEIKLRGAGSAKETVARLRSLSSQYAANQLVADVSYGQGWIDNWAGFITSVHVLSGGAVVLTALLGLLVIGNSVRVSLSQRREEIEILELVGATSDWIRLPYIVEGAALGLVASLVAAGIGFSLQSLVCNYLKQSLQFWSVLQGLRPLSSTGWLAIASVGIAFGAFGAYICVRRLNSGWSAAERLSP